MASIILTAKAEEDLLDIWLYIAADNPDAADRVLDDIDSKFRLLSDNPEIGPARPDIAPEFRYFPVGSYLILYRLLKGNVEIVRVVHGMRNLLTLS
ncbi:MAG: type II toxin-antitoxin system RelE/ParE family toxin [Proteobacteria bacterium]|nr:type II toxin-antitoxin system RelE/ParE family toxin [Pseudomonadota bacterium]